DKASPREIRQRSPPVRASIAAIVPAADAIVTTFPAVLTSRGNPATASTRAVHAWRTPRTATLGPKSAGTGLEPPPPHNEQPASPTTKAAQTKLRTKASRRKPLMKVNAMFTSPQQKLRQRLWSHLAEKHPKHLTL